MLAIWSLVPLPFLKSAWTSGSSQFTYCWSLAWRILSITLLTCAAAAAAAAKSLQSCPTLCDPIDGSPPGSAVPGILRARTVEWVAISISNAWKWKVKVKLFCPVRLLATPWTAAYQALPSMGFSRQEYWSGVPLPSPQTILYWSPNFTLMIHVLGVPSLSFALSARRIWCWIILLTFTSLLSESFSNFFHCGIHFKHNI